MHVSSPCKCFPITNVSPQINLARLKAKQNHCAVSWEERAETTCGQISFIFRPKEMGLRVEFLVYSRWVETQSQLEETPEDTQSPSVCQGKYQLYMLIGSLIPFLELHLRFVQLKVLCEQGTNINSFGNSTFILASCKANKSDE